jgi:single-strand DNA-binding protein
MAYDLNGKVKLVMDTKTISPTFTVREFVVTVEDGKYPQDIALQVVNDKVNLLDNLSEGQEVKVSFDIRGREYNGRYFNNLQAWKIEGGDSGSDAPPSAVPDQDRPPIPDDSEAPGDFDDDIPF